MICFCPVKCHYTYCNDFILIMLIFFVLQVTKHGLILDFLSSFSGQVDFLHMEPEQASKYTEGTEVKPTQHMDPLVAYDSVLCSYKLVRSAS